MEELSIGQKVKVCDSNYKVYIELINRLEDVKDAIKKQNYGIAMDVLCKPYPEFQVTTHSELKESEDERVIKWIIDDIRYNMNNEPLNNSEYKKKAEKAIAWLEKQGNLMKALQISNARIGELIEKNYYLKEQLEKQGKNNMGISEVTKQKLEDNLNKALEKETAESWNEFLEKQGEQKPFGQRDECLHCQFNYAGECKGFCAMKRSNRKPHKSVDKVESKLKIEEGKWYVCTQTYVLRGKIVVIKGQIYQAEKDNVIKGEDGCLFIDRHDGKASDYFRLWTIQDVKDGDILCSNQVIVLFKQWENNTDCCYIIAHAGIDIIGALQITNGHWLISNKSKPATKEQRDLLFQKIKDAGYEWDSEKKELKKIEEKKDIYNKLTAFEFSLKHIIEEAIECGDIHNLKADADLLLRIARKTSWSEEDEERFESCIKVLQTSDGYDTINVKWLKLLKARVQSQPNQEWKQDNTGDLTDFENAMMHIGNSFFGDNAGLDPNDTNAIKEQAKLLLELVPGKEWSEEDERTYKSITYSFAHNYPLTFQQQEFVKSLKDRYTWRPSSEQMEALNDVISSRDIKYDVLSELWKDLKKLREE